jgi:hypothetical protein
VTAMTITRSWTLLIPAPAPLWSTNDSHKKGPRATSASRVQWRSAGYVAAQKAHLPKGLSRVRFAVTFHFNLPERDRRALTSPYGGLTVVITDLGGGSDA